MTFPFTDRLMNEALTERIFTAAAIVVGTTRNVVWEASYGRLGDEHTPQTRSHSIFDLASLTKILCTTPIWMGLFHGEPDILDSSIDRWFPACPEDKRIITPRMLLAHRSGLPAWRPYYLLGCADRDRKQFTADKILGEILESPPGSAEKYSDLGFMILGFIVEREAGSELSDAARTSIYEPLGIEEEMLFRPGSELIPTIAHTRMDDPPGVVNDLNARVLSGIAGHAGLFGTARAAGAMAAQFLRAYREESAVLPGTAFRAFADYRAEPGNAGRALGFDTPSPSGSSAGHYFSSRSIGHTGFTGTSIWIDPDAEIYVVFLTNRVFLGEADFRIKDLRPKIHDAVREEMRGSVGIGTDP